MPDQSTTPPATPDATTARRFGAFGGVFTPCILTILGVILFMRANFVIGQAGILRAVAILLIAKSITLFTALSTGAIATNMQVRGGGAYYLISRVLGPEYGGAIGIALFLAQGVSVPFYILGFTEAIVQTFQPLQPHFRTVALVTAAILLVVTYSGAAWAIRIQYAIMAVLAAAIVFFLSGALRFFSLETFTTNLVSGFTAIEPAAPASGTYNFWIVFAIYFPAVTGIMAGINMSGDLKKPERSIPRGTLAAIGVGFAVYLVQILVHGGAYDRASLTTRPYLLLTDNALFGASLLVAAGMFAATLSSALGSFMGAPRVLQAVARDRILPVIRPLAKGAEKSDEPRRAIILTAAMTLGVLLWAGNGEGGRALNAVAAAITMLFLYTYGMLNVSAFVEAVGGNPSFRPRFRFFHWSTALAGALGCIVVAFIINAPQAAVAIVFLAALVWYLKTRELRTTFGDKRRGFLYKTVRNSLLMLARTEESPHNWRPTALVFSGNPESREALVSYAVWLEAGRGIVFLANILVGPFDEYGPYRDTAIAQLKEFCRKRRIQAFPVVIVDENLEHGTAAMLQALSIGPIRPNLAVFGWSGDRTRVPVSVKHFRMAQALGMGLVVIRDGAKPFHLGRKRIDIWWRGMKNGGLMVILAHLMTRNWEWSNSLVRLLRVVDEEAAREPTFKALEELIEKARVDASPRVIVSDKPFGEVLREHSSNADCVFLGFNIPEQGHETQWFQRFHDRFCEEPTTICVCSVGEEDILA